MDSALRTLVVDNAGSASSTIVNKDPTDVAWITISAQALNTQGLLQIYDGFDVGGKLVFQLEPGYSRQTHFDPPIHCSRAVFVYADANIASYAIGFSSCKHGLS